MVCSSYRGTVCERLETRRLLAGNVAAEVVDGDLVIRGDSGNNWISVDQRGLAAGEVRVTPQDTSIAGGISANMPIVLSGVTGGIRARLGLGDDRLAIEDVNLPGGVKVRAGMGRDAIVLRRASLGAGINVRTRADADSVHVYDSTIGGDVMICTGRGADVVSFDRSTFNGRVDVYALRGSDSLATGGSTFGKLLILDGGAGNNLTTTDGTVRLDCNFANGDEGWQAGFADYQSGWDLGLISEVRPLPAELGRTGSAFFLGGTNHPDDLCMFLKRLIGQEQGLKPGQTYELVMSVEFVTPTPSDVGIGGSPGENVWIKSGAVTAEPVAAPDDTGYVRLNIDKGNQAVGGRDAMVIGTLAAGEDSSDGLYRTIRRTAVFTTQVTVGGDGKLWLFVGTDSGFEGRTEVYFTSVSATLTPVMSEPAMATV